MGCDWVLKVEFLLKTECGNLCWACVRKGVLSPGDRGNGNREDLKVGFRIRMVFVWSCGRKGRAVPGF